MNEVEMMGQIESLMKPELGPVPTVDPKDLKSLWDCSKNTSDIPFMELYDFMKNSCSPGANLKALYTRLSIVTVFTHGTIGAEGNPTDSVFNVLAVFPIEGVGGGWNGDEENLVKLINEETIRLEGSQVE